MSEVQRTNLEAQRADELEKYLANVVFEKAVMQELHEQVKPLSSLANGEIGDEPPDDLAYMQATSVNTKEVMNK